MKQKSRSFLLIFVFLVVFFFVAHRIFFFSPTVVEKISSFIVYPLLQFQRRVVDPLRMRSQNRKTVDELRSEVVRLMIERDELYAKNIELKASMAYAQQIQELLAFKERYEEHEALIAHIIFRHIGRDAQYVLVDAGSQKGVLVDLPVVYKNVLLGRIVEVWPLYSKVLLTTDASCKVAAVCVDTNVHGIHQGTNNTQTNSLAHVSHLLQLKKDDLVISSGEGLVFPRGFALGTVDDFEPAGLHYKVTLRPLISIHCINYCSILFPGS